VTGTCNELVRLLVPCKLKHVCTAPNQQQRATRLRWHEEQETDPMEGAPSGTGIASAPSLMMCLAAQESVTIFILHTLLSVILYRTQIRELSNRRTNENRKKVLNVMLCYSVYIRVMGRREIYTNL
jgi:hypothetical protein